MALAAMRIPEPAAARDRMIVALDVPDIATARSIVDELGDEVNFYKVGWHLFAKGLVDFIEHLITHEKRVFLDFKSVDIGETMRGMITSVSRIGVDFVTVMGTSETIQAASAGRIAKRPKVLVVTLLTDHSEAEMRREYNTQETVEQFVARRARQAAAAGADGVISSAREVAAIRRELHDRPDFLIVTPGIRPADARQDDQKRVMTPGEAITAGSDYLVIGRPIVKAPDRAAAAERILNEMQDALNNLR